MMKGIIYSLNRRSSIGCRAIFALCFVVVAGYFTDAMALPFAHSGFIGSNYSWGLAPLFPYDGDDNTFSYDVLYDDLSTSHMASGSGATAIVGPGSIPPGSIYVEVAPDRGAGIARASFTRTSVFGNFNQRAFFGSGLVYFSGMLIDATGIEHASLEALISIEIDVFSNGLWTSVGNYFQTFDLSCPGVDCFSPGCCDGSVSGDGFIYPGDLVRISSEFRANAFAVNPIPEPPSLSVALFGMIALVIGCLFLGRQPQSPKRANRVEARSL
jgi:hypothetical protein